MSKRDYIQPKWPDHPFNLRALDGGWEIGPFTKDGFDVQPDGSLLFSDGYSHPTTLRVTEQHQDILHANDGPDPMVYQIVPAG